MRVSSEMFPILQIGGFGWFCCGSGRTGAFGGLGMCGLDRRGVWVTLFYVDLLVCLFWAQCKVSDCRF